MTNDEEKRLKEVKDVLNAFNAYFAYHGVFFLFFSAQNYFLYEENGLQLCFIVLVVFYMQFVVSHIRHLRNKREMQRMSWLKSRLYLRIIEHGLMALTMLLLPFYI